MFFASLQESKMLHLHEGIGVCEQLMGIPIPLSYTRLTSRFLVFWHLTLPIILWDECHWIVVPATFISAASLFCIEEVGVLIEEPFPMLALDELCDLVHSNIQEAVKSEKVIRNRIIAKIKLHEFKHSSNGRHRS
jgi:predicted membrane chloride channel (bestrophin family)